MPNDGSGRHAHHHARSPSFLPRPHLVLVTSAIAFAVIAGRQHAFTISTFGPVLGDGARHGAGSHAGDDAGTAGVTPVVPVVFPTPVIVTVVVVVSHGYRGLKRPPDRECQHESSENACSPPHGLATASTRRMLPSLLFFLHVSASLATYSAIQALVRGGAAATEPARPVR